MRRKLGVILLVLTLANVTMLMAQDRTKATISGYVLDRERRPISLANIKIDGTGLGTFTDSKGHYKLVAPKTQDSLTLVYTCLGYKSASRKLPSLKSSLRINIELGEEELLIDPIVIVDRKRISPSLERLDTEHLTVSVGPSSGVESIVGTLSGVSQKNELSNQYSVRGGSFDENLVYINGVEVYRPLLARSAEQEGLSSINPDMTSNLQFSAGGFGVDYGDKISSVLDVRYRRPDSLEGATLLGMMESRLYVGGKQSKLRYLIGARQKRGASLLETLDTRAEYDPHYSDIQATVSYQLAPALELSFFGAFNNTSYTFVPKTRQTTFGTLSNAKQLTIAFDGREEDTFHTWLGASTLQWIPNAKHRHSLTYTAYSSRERETYDIASEYVLAEAAEASPASTNALGIGRTRSHARNNMSFRANSLAWRSQFALNDRQRLVGGIDLKFERVSEEVMEWTMRDSVGYTTPMSNEILSAHNSRTGHQKLTGHRLSTFVEDRLSIPLPHGDLSLNAGIRASWWSWTKEFFLSPRLGITYSPKKNKALLYRGALGLYHQSPSYREIKQESSNALGEVHIHLNQQTRSQRALTALMGIDYTFRLIGRQFKLSTEGYLKYITHLNPYIQENIRLRYLGSNIGSAYIVGLDTRLYGEFVEGVDSWISLSLLHGRQQIPAKALSAPLTNAPSVNLSLFFQDYFPGFKPIRLSLRGAYSSGVPVYLPGQELSVHHFTSSAYRRIDIGLVYRLTQGADGHNQRWWSGRFIKYIDLGIDAFNLFDMLNTSNYYWITDAYNHNYAVPNYLTRRAWNVYLKLGL